ncbi:DUF4878 domain-containing protein [Williamsia deligens]|uniref:DUF4878 domain-containing protein n=1 Tax=Williamsia deligens TaxID=321325 RepID=A0ABW3G6L8_9NOCA|nr:DUF4878 domain-containing protein [Williamsia deligens]MCP2194747.1 hypothetical protein [Williamsia deligens]
MHALTAAHRRRARLVAVAAAGLLVALPVAACSDDSSSTAAGSSSASQAAGPASGDADAPAGLDSAAAQQILRTVLDPTTSPQVIAGLVDSGDATVGTTLNGFARGAAQGGYTPDKFTVTGVRADGTDKAQATVSVASPHTPAPVSVQYGYTRVAGAWKLSSDAVQSLLGMASGPR